MKSLSLILLMFWGLVCSAQVNDSVSDDTLYEVSDSFYFLPNDSLIQDSIFRSNIGLSKKTLLDSLGNDTLLALYFHPYYAIKNPFLKFRSTRADVPGIKEIQLRPVSRHQWRFWVICFILLYIGFIRIANPNNFKVFLLSVFNLKLSQKIWEEQRTTFSFVTLQLFAIYIFIASIFIMSWMEMHNLNPTGNFFYSYSLICLFLILSYFVKFTIHSLMGGLLKIKKMGIGFVSNTVSVNNFIALVIFPFIIFLAYSTDKLWHTILTQTVISIFFISVLYRLFRIVVLSSTFFTFPRIYLFIYLCALEILPWFIIVKFINTYPI